MDLIYDLLVRSGLMHPLLNKIEKIMVERALNNKAVPEMNPGDTIKVNVKITEGANTRIQAFQGVLIGKRNRGIRTSICVRKISHGIGVEKVFMVHSPAVHSIEVVSRGLGVRRAKLYFLRKLAGKAAKIPQTIVSNK